MASKKELDELKAVLKINAAKEAQDLEFQFFEKGLGRLGRLPKLITKSDLGGTKYRGRRGGEWDWWANLSKAEKSRISSNWTALGGMQPDQFGIDDSIPGQFRSVDEGVEEFLDLTRRIDVLKRYANTGKLPKNMDAYGGLDLDSIFSGVVSDYEMDMRVSMRISGLYGEDPLGYLSKLEADSALEQATRYDFLKISHFQGYKKQLEQILAKPFEEMTKEEDLIVNRSDHITTRLRAEIEADKLKKPSSLPSRPEQKLQTFEIAKKTAIADGKRKTNLLPIGTVVDTPKAGVPVGDTVKDKLASIQALKNAAISQSTEPISRR